MSEKVKNGLFKRGDNWNVCVKVRGKTIRKSIGKSKAEAELVLAEIRKQSKIAKLTGDWSGLDNMVKPKSTKSFGEAACDYLAERANSAPSTLRTYDEYLRLYLLPVFSTTKLVDITEEQVAAFQIQLSKRLSATRTNSAVGLLRSILKVCVKRGLLSDNAAAGVDGLRQSKTKVDPLSIDELDRVFACISEHYRPIFVCLAFTGARPAELKALRYTDCDFVRAEISITKNRVKKDEGKTKTASSERVIPMFPRVREALEELKKRPIQAVDGHIFVDTNGRPINRGLDQIWSAALKKAGVRHRASYQLRHTYASLCFAEGASPGWVAKTMGHSSLQITYRYYARFINDAERLNERIMEKAFAVKTKPATEQTGTD